MNYIFSFSSRNGAFRFRDAVAAAGGNVQIVNAPIKSGEGCGLAVKCFDYALCQRVLSDGQYACLGNVYSYDGLTYKSLYNGSD